MPGFSAWLGIVAVLLLQTQVAAHAESEHHAGTDLAETCEVCLALDSSGKAPPVVDATAPLPTGRSDTPVAKPDLPHTSVVRLPDARGPPRLQ